MLSAQDLNVAKLSSQYPLDDAIELINEREVEIFIKEGKVNIKSTRENETFYLNNSAKQYSKESISHSTFFEILEIKAETSALVNGKRKKFEVTEFKEKDEMQSFYDDVKSLNFIFPNLQTGSKTSLKVTEEIKDPRMLNPFYFGGYFPRQKSKLKITVDKNIAIEFREFNLENYKITREVDKKRNKTVYTFESENMPGFDFEPQSPSFRYYGPHVFPIITSYTLEGKKVEIAGETKNLYNWYYSLLNDVNTSPPSSELKEIVSDLTKDCKNDEEKVKTLFYWVQSNIKYIAFEYALGGFIPRNANDICRKKYGDCKDNSSILDQMLHIAGIEGHFTWIGTRDLPYTYEELPTVATDNHMILSYKNEDGKVIFLDGTANYLPWGMPTRFIQGKEALVGINKDSFEVHLVPVVPAEINSEKDITHLTINAKDINGSTVKKFDGYKKVEVFNNLIKMSETQKKNYHKSLLKKGNDKFSYAELQEEFLYDYDSIYTLRYNFKIQDYLLNIDNEMYLNLNLNKPMEHYNIPDIRKTDIKQDYKSLYDYEVILDIPAGYEVSYLPEDFKINDTFVDANITYRKEAGKVIYNQNLKVNFLVLPKSNHDEYRSISDKILKAYTEHIVLTKNNL